MGFACGHLLSTVGDLFKWNQAVFKQVLLGKQMLDSVLAPVKLKNGNTSTYGLGWMNQTILGKRCYRHDGSVMGFGAEIRYFPEEDIFMAFLVNGRSQETDARTMDLINQVTQLSLGKPVLAEFSITAAMLQQYTGVYALNEEHKILVTLENGQLYIEGSNPADQITKIPVYPYQVDHFFTKGPDFKMEFRKDNAGNYAKIVTTARSKFIFEWKKEKWTVV
ncbi:beta-lactamase [Pseudobacter ginsenosidimutans]|uniref:Beta-lactamase n=1 Tax=Pseudobacter ginsenosidimutans TaxID=661488 RepID=A0A4Q7MRX6_9BACT|nr:beta-lactamase [Pseudobacter ginsenosidimutans]